MKYISSLKSATSILKIGVVLCAISLWTGCSDDDENGGADSLGSEVGVFVDDDGVSQRINNIGSYIYYEWDGDELVGIEFGDNDFKVTTSPFTVTVWTDEDYDPEVLKFYDFKFNSSGYISSYKKIDDITGRNYSEHYECNVTVSYNANDQISKQVAKVKYTEVYDGERESESYTATLTYNYSVGNLVSCEEYVPDEEPYSLTFTYNGVSNPHQQYALLPTSYMDDDFLCVFGILGLAGKASKLLPSSLTNDGDTYKFSYKVENGLIIAERMNSEWETAWVNYNYSNTTKGLSPVNRDLGSNENILKTLRPRFMHRSKRVR